MNGWIKTTERLPTLEESNNYGEVFVANEVKCQPVQYWNWNQIIRNDNWFWCKCPDRPKPPLEHIE